VKSIRVDHFFLANEKYSSQIHPSSPIKLSKSNCNFIEFIQAAIRGSQKRNPPNIWSLEPEKTLGWIALQTSSEVTSNSKVCTTANFLKTERFRRRFHSSTKGWHASNSFRKWTGSVGTSIKSRKDFSSTSASNHRAKKIFLARSEIIVTRSVV
jgi:hypothetical protein